MAERTRERMQTLHAGIKEECIKIYQKLDSLIIMIAKRFHVSLLAKLLSKKYSDPIIQRKISVPVTVGDTYVTRPRN